jgi:nitrogen fixation-related uncharacterized protein
MGTVIIIVWAVIALLAFISLSLFFWVATGEAYDWFQRRRHKRGVPKMENKPEPILPKNKI